MNTALNKKRIHDLFIHIVYLVFLVSVVFSFRAVSSISVATLLIAGLLTNKPAFAFQNKTCNLFLAGCILLSLLQLATLFYTDNRQQGWNNVLLKTGLLITPFAVCATYPDVAARKKILSHYCLVLFLATLYCLLVTSLHFRKTNDTSLFFYHALVAPLNQHAVYFSVLITIGLIFLAERLAKKDFFFNWLFHLFLVVYLSIFLFLLSSKLVICFYIIYLAYFFVNLIYKVKPGRLIITGLFSSFVIITGLLFAVRNPVSERFYDVLNGKVKIITQDRFDQGDYFNGLQFRLLQWRFVAEILNEKKSWWEGVSPGDSQNLLNEKFTSKNMYSGDPVKGTRGYLIYNTHNQFLETALQNGIAGLFALSLICFSLFRMVREDNVRITTFIVLLLIAWLFTESVFETQYGIIIFTFFPLLLYSKNRQRLAVERQPGNPISIDRQPV